MKRVLLLLCLFLLPAAAYAGPSGVDANGIKESVRAAGEDIAARLAAAEAGYRRLISSTAVDAAAYAEYRGGLAGTGEAVKVLSGHVKSFSGFMAGLERTDPKPDDIESLRALNTYAEERKEAAEARYAEALRKLDQLDIRIKARAAAYARALGLNLDPAAAEKEKQRQLKAAQAARDMGNKERELDAIMQFSGLDPQKGAEMMGQFFDGLSPAERGVFSEQLKAGAPAVTKGPQQAPPSGGPAPKPLYRPMGAVVPDMSGAQAAAGAAAAQPVKKSKPLFTGNDLSLGLWSAVDKFSPATAAPHLREAKLTAAADAKTDWLDKKRQDFLALAAGAKDEEERAGHQRTAARIDGLLAKKNAISGVDGVDQRSAALGEWNTSVSRLMDGSLEGTSEKALVDRKAALDAEYAGLKTDEERARWIKERGGEYDESGRKLAAFYLNNPEYLKARRTEADAQLFMRSNMANFKDGTEFTSDELGLKLPPGQKVSIGSLKDGVRGISYTDKNGLSHFQSFDDTVRVNEVADPSGEKHVVEVRLAGDGTVNTAERLADGRLFRTEQKKPDGSITAEVYGADGKAVASRLTKPDGSTVEALVLEKEGVKRLIYTDPKGAATYEVSSLAGHDGYPKQSGRIVNGVMVMDRLDLDPATAKVRTGENLFETRAGGKVTGAEVDMEAIKRLPEAERAAAIRAAAAALGGGDRNKAGPLYQFMAQAARQGGPGAKMDFVAVTDEKGSPLYLATIISANGSRKQVLGQWDKLSRAEAVGLPSDVGLNISVRCGATGEDISKRNYLKLFRFNGDNITDRYGSEGRVTGNWFVGYGAEADNFIHRSYSGTNRDFKTIKTGTEELYTSPTIFGHAGNAIGTLGKGAVQLTGSALAVAGAGTVGWADKDLQAEFLERAKSNFYGNDVSRALGRDYIGGRYEEGYARLDVKEDRNIQNVGREMASMGQPTLGAVLQGGVNFSNGVATTLITAPLGGPLAGALGKTGTVGATVANAAGKGYGAYKGVKGVYDTGASGVEFVQAYRAFDENDPASKERYYAAITDLTAKGLNAPKTVSGAFKLAATAKEVKGVLTARGPSPILGADGKPYQAPPEELSDFRKFMLGKNEPGVLTRVMTKDISRGLDPKINLDLSNNPVSNAVNSAGKWAGARLDRWAGMPEEMPKPGLILPGQAAPNPDARIIIPGRAAPVPEVKLIVPGQAAANPDAKIIIPGQAVPRPDAQIVVPGQAAPAPDARIIVPGN